METRVSTCTHRDMYMYVYYIRASIIHVNMLLADENLHNEKVAQKLLGPQFEQGFVPAKPREFFICHFNRILNTGRLRMHQEWTGPKRCGTWKCALLRGMSMRDGVHDLRRCIRQHVNVRVLYIFYEDLTDCNPRTWDTRPNAREETSYLENFQKGTSFTLRQ